MVQQQSARISIFHTDMGKLKRIFDTLFKPIAVNIWFFTFTFIVSLLVYYLEREFDWRAVAQFFFEIYLTCVVLSLLKGKVRTIAKTLIYTIFYSLTIIDFACWILIDSPITPTLVQITTQTNPQEAGEALASYINSDLFRHGSFDIILLLMGLNILFESGILSKIPIVKKAINTIHKPRYSRLALGIATAIALPLSCASCIYNFSENIYSLCSNSNQGLCDLFNWKRAKLWHTIGAYNPIWRTLKSIKTFSLNASILEELEKTVDNIIIQNRHENANIILIIGESYNRHHSSLYGYDKNTTPLQEQMQASGNMAVFTDVVSSWHMTAESFQHMFSMHSYGDEGEWYQYPTFAAITKKAGYHVAYVTQQFTKRINTDYVDFRGGIFINTDKLSNAQFDTRNIRKAKYDGEFLQVNNSLTNLNNKGGNLIIIHLYAQHFNYSERFPDEYKRFKPSDYPNRTDLTDKQRQILADYDNATLYNDFVVKTIVEKYKDDDAIIIYVPDHGERVFDNCQECYRTQSMKPNDARQQFEIPFWIYCTPQYQASHPEIWQSILSSTDKPYMTDNLAQLIIGLAGIDCPYYKDENNLISPNYNASRKRLLKGEIDYDKDIKNK